MFPEPILLVVNAVGTLELSVIYFSWSVVYLSVFCWTQVLRLFQVDWTFRRFFVQFNALFVHRHAGR